MTKPYDRIVPTKEVLQNEGFSRTTLWRKIKAGTFPRPIWVTATSQGFFQSDLARRQAEVRAAAGLPDHIESNK
jgi:predicted DNA-binding transcriptional regulator AlpA